MNCCLHFTLKAKAKQTILWFANFNWFTASLSGGHVVGNFSPYEAFVIGGTNSVRGYEEGGVGSGRSYVVGSGEISFPMVLIKPFSAQLV